MSQSGVAPRVFKVLLYVIDVRSGVPHVLVFDHADAPEAGVQVPGGTVEPGESHEHAVQRELLEETGLTTGAILGWLGPFDYWHPHRRELHLRHVAVVQLVEPAPERWEHIVTGRGEDIQLRFVCHWLPTQEAVHYLAGDQSAYLVDALQLIDKA